MRERLIRVERQTLDEAILDHRIRGAEIDARLISADEQLGQEIANGQPSLDTLTVLGDVYGEQLQASVDGPKMKREIVLFDGKIQVPLPSKSL